MKLFILIIIFFNFESASVENGYFKMFIFIKNHKLILIVYEYLMILSMFVEENIFASMSHSMRYI